MRPCGAPINTSGEAVDHDCRRPGTTSRAYWFESVVGAYPYGNMHSYIRQAYDAFGPLRVFWGTDLTKLPCTYRQTVTMFIEELAWLTRQDKEWIMGRGLCEWLGWPMGDTVGHRS